MRLLLQYRPEIDGLRAIAVISVVLYHAGIKAFEGGFVGVDIFFVISGYLITTIILKEIANQSFSFAQFYERRARRILPALFFVMLATIPFAWEFLLPKAFIEYGRSFVSTMLFGSNIQFWLEDSYVSELSILKPFLHTWTLSLEEQFYLIFPVIMITCWKYYRKHLDKILFSIFIASLLLAQWGSKNHSNANFYLLHSRMWELLAGSILARMESLKGSRFFPSWGKFMPTLGLLLILVSVFTFNEQTPHPSIITVLPVLGSALIVWFGGRNDLITKLFASKIFVTIGLMSYSIYLWHQPIFAFTRTYMGLSLDFSTVAYCIVLTFGLSLISWQLIEKPFRNRSKITSPVLWKGAAFGSLLFIIFGVGSIFTKGFVKRMPKEITKASMPQFLKFAQQNKPCWGRENFPEDICRTGDESLVILGDSSIATILPTLHSFTKDTSVGFLDLTWGQCPYHSGINHRVKDCSAINLKRDEFIKNLKTKKTFIIGYDLTQLKKASSQNDEPVPFQTAATSVLQKIDSILNEGHRVILLKQLPPINQNTGQLLRFAQIKKIKNLETVKFPGLGKPADMAEYDEIFSTLKPSKNLLVIDPKPSFCEMDKNVCWANLGLNAYFTDKFNHLSPYGAQIVVHKIQEAMKSKWGQAF